MSSLATRVQRASSVACSRAIAGAARSNFALAAAAATRVQARASAAPFATLQRRFVHSSLSTLSFPSRNMSASGSGSSNADVHKQPIVPATEEDKTKIAKMVKECNNLCMLVTIDPSGSLHSRPMGVSGEVETQGEHMLIHFFTYGKSHKVMEMNQHGHQVNLSFSHPGQQSYLSVSGLGSISRDKEDMKKRWSPMLNAWFPKGLDEPDVALLRVQVNKAEYWDAPSSTVAHAISFVKSQLTGKPADPADHKAVSL